MTSRWTSKPCRENFEGNSLVSRVADSGLGGVASTSTFGRKAFSLIASPQLQKGNCAQSRQKICSG